MNVISVSNFKFSSSPSFFFSFPFSRNSRRISVRIKKKKRSKRGKWFDDGCLCFHFHLFGSQKIIDYHEFDKARFHISIFGRVNEKTALFWFALLDVLSLRKVNNAQRNEINKPVNAIEKRPKRRRRYKKLFHLHKMNFI